MSNFEFFNPNPKQRFHKDGTPMRWMGIDCSVRALCKAEDISWKKSYEILATSGMNHYMMPNDPDLLKLTFQEIGYTRYTYKSNERPTVKQFAKKMKGKTCLAMVVGHIVATKNGKYYDAWDSGDYKVTSYYVK